MRVSSLHAVFSFRKLFCDFLHTEVRTLRFTRNVKEVIVTMRPCIDVLSWCTKFVGEVQNEERKVENSHLFLYWEGSLRGSIKSILVNYSTPNALWEECLQSQPDLILISKLVSLECRHRCHPSISILA